MMKLKIFENTKTNLQICWQTHLKMRWLELVKSDFSHPEDKSAKTYYPEINVVLIINVLAVCIGLIRDP